MDKKTLMNTIQTEYTQFESLIAPLTEAQLCQTAYEGEWSIKDILAHIAVWEQLCAKWLAECVGGETPNPSERNDMQSNDRIYQANRGRTLAEVRELFKNAHQQFLSQVDVLFQTLTEEDINASHRFAWTKYWPGYSIMAVISDNSYEHHYDHTQQILSWIDRIRS